MGIPIHRFPIHLIHIYLHDISTFEGPTKNHVWVKVRNGVVYVQVHKKCLLP